jgi:DNA-binding MarR family transcriptional regulator
MPTTRSKSSRAQAGGDTRRADDDITLSVDAFRRVLRALRVAARKTELATGLSAAQLFVLSAVAAAPGCSLNEIADATMTDRSSAAAIVDRLVEQGHVTREQSGDDKRRASIEITARGRRATQSAAPAPAALLVDGLRGLSPSQRQTLARNLVNLTRAMGIDDEPAGLLFEDSAPRKSPSVRPRRKAR